MPTPIAFTRPDQRQVVLLAWSDYDLLMMAHISDEDIQRSRAYWLAHLPRRYRLLLDATTVTSPDAVHVLPVNPPLP